MHKVVYNACYGGFGLSAKAIAHILRQNKPDVELFFYKEDAKNGDWHYTKCNESEASHVFLKDFGDEFYYAQVNQVQFNDNVVYDSQVYTSRHDPCLIKAVEELEEEASNRYADLRIAEIESNLYRIDENDGLETVITPEGIDWIKIS